ncbi:MAG: hypothetical protein R3F07_03215 [Opitutaceae bacterium]
MSTSILIADSVAEGAPRKLLVRTVGATLWTFGVSGALPDTVLEIVKDDQTIAENDDWSDAANSGFIFNVSAALEALRLKPGRLDSDVQTILYLGAYSFRVGAKDGATGVALVGISKVL